MIRDSSSPRQTLPTRPPSSRQLALNSRATGSHHRRGTCIPSWVQSHGARGRHVQKWKCLQLTEGFDTESNGAGSAAVSAPWSCEHGRESLGEACGLQDLRPRCAARSCLNSAQPPSTVQPSRFTASLCHRRIYHCQPRQIGQSDLTRPGHAGSRLVHCPGSVRNAPTRGICPQTSHPSLLGSKYAHALYQTRKGRGGDGSSNRPPQHTRA